MPRRELSERGQAAIGQRLHQALGYAWGARDHGSKGDYDPVAFAEFAAAEYKAVELGQASGVEPVQDQYLRWLAARMSEQEARELAGEWHGGQGSALYAFASSGTVTEGLADEVSDAIREAAGHTAIEQQHLRVLLQYVTQPPTASQAAFEVVAELVVDVDEA